MRLVHFVTLQGRVDRFKMTKQKLTVLGTWVTMVKAIAMPGLQQSAPTDASPINFARSYS